MKKFLIMALVLLSVSGVYAQSSKDTPSQNQAESGQKSVPIQLPPALYAVPGTELNVYFDNIVLVPNIKNIVFDVECQKGRQDVERWRFIPEAKDVGSFPLAIKVYDADSTLLAEAATIVFVSPKDTGKGKNISLMLLGDSLTGASIYPQEVYDLLKKDGINAKFIGTNSSVGFPVKEGIAAHEGRGGWTWGGYCTTFENPKEDRPIYKSSPFLVKKDDKVVLDFKNYCDKNNDGTAPDFITIFLGANDIFSSTDANIEQNIENIFKNADTLLNEFRTVAPNTKIGIALTPPPAGTQDAFGENYKCNQNRWQYRKNQYRYVDALMKKFGGCEKENLFIIPVFVNLDCMNNYPQKEEQINARSSRKILRNSNGLHPAREGYLQIADSFYAWFKYELNQK